MKTAPESVIKALAKAMAEARAGNVEAVAIVCASPEGVPVVHWAGESELVCQINTGCDMLKNYLLGKIVLGEIQKTSGLVRPAEQLNW